MATTMNKENNPAPRCPYCGAEMRLEDNEDVIFGLFADEEKMYWYQCNTPSCGIHSPANHTKEGAYKAAMKRRQEPNRVLTLEEVFVIASSDYNTPEQETVLWLERRVEEGGYATIPNIFAEDGKIVAEFSGIGFEVALITEGYGKHWRCWRRKPTKNERETAPWEDEGR